MLLSGAKHETFVLFHTVTRFVCNNKKPYANFYFHIKIKNVKTHSAFQSTKAIILPISCIYSNKVEFRTSPPLIFFPQYKLINKKLFWSNIFLYLEWVEDEIKEYTLPCIQFK